MLIKSNFEIKLGLCILQSACLVLLGCGDSGSSGDPSSDGNGGKNQSEYIHSGSVGDGPIINSVITTKNANNSIISSFFSGNVATYRATIPANSLYPVTISASGGTDLVTNEEPDFSLVTTALASDQEIANLNPYSTLITKVAQKIGSTVNQETLNIANFNIISHLNFGLNIDKISNPINSVISADNITTLVKASEGLAELFRRIQRTLDSAKMEVSYNYIINAIAADMTDGILDGIGSTGSDPLIASIANVLSAQITTELISDNFMVNGKLAIDAIDTAIAIAYPEFTTAAKAKDIPLTDELLSQARKTLNAVSLIVDSANVPNMLNMVSSLQPGITAANGGVPVVPYFSIKELGDIALILAFNGATKEWETINKTIRSETLRELDNRNLIRIPPVSATASEIFDDSHGPNYAIDQLDNTHWVAYSAPQSLTVDLGSPQTVSDIEISFLNHFRDSSYNFSIAFSSDSNNWTNVLTPTNTAQDAQWIKVSLTPAQTRYIRVSIHSLTGSFWVGINEINIMNRKTPNSSPGNSGTNSNPGQNNNSGSVIGIDDIVNTAMDTPTTFSVTKNDIGPIQTDAVLTISQLPSNGIVVVNQDSTVTYTPNPGYIGWDSFTYTVKAANGLASTAAAYITVTCDTCGNPNFSVKLTWNANTDVVDGYIVYYGSSANTAVIPLKLVDATQLSPDTKPEVSFLMKEDLHLNPGDNLCFRVKAYRSLTESEFSAPVCSVL